MLYLKMGEIDSARRVLDKIKRESLRC